MTGDSDTLVPPSHMKKLYELALKSTHREFYSVLGGGHNDSWEVSGAEYYIVSIPIECEMLTALCNDRVSLYSE